jgi:hypothetical protein
METLLSPTKKQNSLEAFYDNKTNYAIFRRLNDPTLAASPLTHDNIVKDNLQMLLK